MYIILHNLESLFKWISYTKNRKWRDRRNGKNIGKIKCGFCLWMLSMVDGGMVSCPLMKMERGHFSGAVRGSTFSYRQWRTPLYGGITIRDFSGETPVPISGLIDKRRT